MLSADFLPNVVFQLEMENRFVKVSRSVVSDSLCPHGLYSPWDCKESDMSECPSIHIALLCLVTIS